MRVHEEWRLLPQRLALHEPTGLAVVADLHLGYSQARRRQGDAIPVPRLATVLAPLARAAALYPLRGLLIAGDLFERGYDAEIYHAFRAFLAELDVPLVGLVPGNHDRGVERHLESALLWPDGYEVGGWLVRHGDAAAPAERSVQGHLHPAVRLRGRKYPCFAIGPQQIVLPAFSHDAAGGSVAASRRGRDWRWVAIVGETLVEASGGAA